MYKESRELMDTYCTITVVSPTKEKAQEAIEAGFGEIKKLEILLNYFSGDSEISAINKAAGSNAVKVSSETLDIMQKTLKISELTNGAFDPTIAPVISLWPFSNKTLNNPVPSREIVEKALALVNYKKITVNPETAEIHLNNRGMEIDLGGIAKGYAADRAVQAIKGTGVSAALVAVAGDIRGFGMSSAGNVWKVGIQNPRADEENPRPWEDVIATISLKDRAVSTSGDYQRFLIKEGKRYHHILDPRTGYPAENNIMSVSVIAPEGYVTDSLSTAIFVMGISKGMRLLDSMGVDGIIIDSDKKIHTTHNMKEILVILNDEYSLAE
jgi:thiamine biosynthesis lipoprotein